MIEPLTAADVERVIALWEACGLTRPWNDPRLDFLRAINGPSSTVLGLFEPTPEAGGSPRLLGTVLVGGDGHRGWVYYLAVDQTRRHQGLGRQLMAAAEGWLVTHGLPKIQFMIRSSNTQVIDFYKRLGYEPVEVVTMGRRLD